MARIFGHDGDDWEPVRPQARLAGYDGHGPPRIDPPRIVWPTRLDPEGKIGPTPGCARGANWRRTGAGLYVRADAEFDQPAQRIAEVAARLPAGAAVTGWASLHLAGARWFEGERADGELLPVPVALGPGVHVRPIPGAVLHRTVQPEVVIRHGVPCAHVLRSVYDEVRARITVDQQVAALEMACFAELTSLSRFRDYLGTMGRHKGVGVVRSAAARAIEGAESPQEVSMRVTLEDEGSWVGLLPNRRIYSLDGRFLARPDLVDPATGVVGEYDGTHHLAVGARRKDLGREGKLRAHGMEYFTVVAGEIGTPGLVAGRMRDATARVLASGVPRRWTLTPPTGAHHPTLDERMARRPEPS